MRGDVVLTCQTCHRDSPGESSEPGSDQGGSFPFRKPNKAVYTLETSRTAGGVPRFSRDFREDLRHWTRMPERISRASRHRVSLQGGREWCPCSLFPERVANKRVNSPGRNRP